MDSSNTLTKAWDHTWIVRPTILASNSNILIPICVANWCLFIRIASLTRLLWERFLRHFANRMPKAKKNRPTQMIAPTITASLIA